LPSYLSSNSLIQDEIQIDDPKPKVDEYQKLADESKQRVKYLTNDAW
jgi:hypothetical protein